MKLYPCKTLRGVFGVSIKNDALSRLIFPNQFNGTFISEQPPVLINRLADDLNILFDAKTVDWSSYPLDMSIGTEFQINVWKMLQRIPFGATYSYSEIAHLMNSRAVRAVGSACACNPIPIVIPCHRVIQKSGNLGNYTGGVEWKRFLLKCEGICRYEY